MTEKQPGPAPGVRPIESSVKKELTVYIKLIIFDAVRTIEDVMEFSERYNLEGRMISMDSKKAFHTVSRDFLFRTLTSFGFGPSFLKWIYTFYNYISSCVINNGFSTQPFSS